MTVAENGKSDDKGEQTMEELLREVLSGSRMLHFEGTKKDEAPLVEAAGRDAGYVEDEGALYEKMTVRKYLKFFAGLSGTEKRVRSAVEQMHLSELLGKRLCAVQGRGLSCGGRAHGCGGVSDRGGGYVAPAGVPAGPSGRGDALLP